MQSFSFHCFFKCQLLINNHYFRMSETKQKKTSRLAPRIHRRKNVEIPKDFFCPDNGCGKGYGSYAALYTHLKNKHPEIKPPNMPNGNKNKHVPQGRPKMKKSQNEKIEEQKVFCKICMQVECNCVEEFDSEDKNKTLQIMSSDKFINFISEVGLLAGEDQFSWVRRTDEDYNYKSPEAIKMDIKKFKEEHTLEFILSQKLIDYLSFSSKYWNPECVEELYNTIYVILAFENYGATLDYIRKNSNKFLNICRCVENNEDVFKRFENSIRII